MDVSKLCIESEDVSKLPIETKDVPSPPLPQNSSLTERYKTKRPFCVFKFVSRKIYNSFFFLDLSYPF